MSNIATDRVQFISGLLVIPSHQGVNNRGVITDQIVPGHDYIEAALYWRMLEPKQNQFRWDEIDEMLALMKPRGQKMHAFPWINYAPEWFKKSEHYVPLQEANTSNKVDILSPWAPGTWWAYDHFYGNLAAKYHNEFDIILIGLPSSDYGEAGYPGGGEAFTNPSESWGMLFPQSKDAWHMGMWCGDPYAVRGFRQSMARKYKTIGRLNQVWGTRYSRWDQLEMIQMDDRMKCPQRWLDLISFYNNGQVGAVRKALQIVRKHFPLARLEIPQGFGCDLPQYGIDRTALSRVTSEFTNTSIRSTHGSFNRWIVPAAYWFYKRIVPVCRKYGAGFGTEPPGGDLTVAEMKRQLFEDASVSANLLYSYYQNWHTLPNVAKQWSTFCRPSVHSLVSVGVIYSNTQMALDMATYPEGQWELFDALRPTVDMDVVDENMMDWGMLSQYRVLINTSAWTYTKRSLGILRQWLQNGGTLITRSDTPFKDVEGRTWIAGGLGVGQRLSVGRGFVTRLDDTDILRWSSAICQMLRQMAASQPDLHGVNPKQDGKWRTEFTDRWLSYEPKAGRTTWEFSS